VNPDPAHTRPTLYDRFQRSLARWPLLGGNEGIAHVIATEVTGVGEGVGGGGVGVGVVTPTPPLLFLTPAPLSTPPPPPPGDVAGPEEG
jgi:hypothetical protein